MDITVTLEDGEELTDGEIIVNDARGVVVRTSTSTRLIPWHRVREVHLPGPDELPEIDISVLG
jgi:hypothetical protein